MSEVHHLKNDLVIFCCFPQEPCYNTNRMEEMTENKNISVMLCSVGDAYYSGLGMKSNRKEAMRFYRKAASLGNSYAMFRMGECYENGTGTNKDAEEAFQYYQKSAETGCIPGMLKVGDYYWSGMDGIVAQSKEKAAQWYLQALKKNDAQEESLDEPFVYVRIADCMKDGIGMEKNLQAAHELYQAAVEDMMDIMPYDRMFDYSMLERAEKGEEELRSKLHLPKSEPVGELIS